MFRSQQIQFQQKVSSQTKRQETSQEQKQRSQVGKVHSAYSLSALIVNEGIDLYADFFTKTINFFTEDKKESVKPFFYIRKYSLEKFDKIHPNHPYRDQIERQLGFCVANNNMTQKVNGEKENAMGSILYEICQLLGIQISCKENIMNSNGKRHFPKIQYIMFGGQYHESSAFYRGIEMEKKLRKAVNDKKNFREKVEMKMTRKGEYAETIEEMKERLDIEIIVKVNDCCFSRERSETRSISEYENTTTFSVQNSTIISENTLNNSFENGNGQQYQISSEEQVEQQNNYYQTINNPIIFEWNSNNRKYIVQLLNNYQCLLIDENQNATLSKYVFDMNGMIYFY